MTAEQYERWRRAWEDEAEFFRQLGALPGADRRAFGADLAKIRAMPEADERGVS